MVPAWLHILAVASLILGAACAAAIAADLLRHPQQMWIMNVVWPVVALFAHVVALWGYLRYGRLAAREVVAASRERGETPPHLRTIPFPVQVAKGTAHCGAGCTLGDLAAEWLLVAVPGAAAAFGLGTLFPERIFAAWVLDYLFAMAFGIAFQFFTIRPMRNLSVGRGLVEAAKADTLSLTSWQVGMYGFMAFAHFWLFGRVWGTPLRPASAEFWFMMQLAMLLGFVTAYPVNWWLLRAGVKEAM